MIQLMILHTQIVKMEESVDEKVESQNVSSPRILVKSSIALYTIFLMLAIRLINAEGVVHYPLLLGKSQVAPLKFISIPQFELQLYPSRYQG